MTITKVMGWGGGETRCHAGEGNGQKIVQSRGEENKFLQSESHCRALYPPEWQFCSHFSVHT